MRADEREDRRYAAGAQNRITRDERLMFSLLPPPPGHLLDVGCGVGTIGLELQRRGFDVTGVDFSAVAVEKAVDAGLNAVHSDVDGDGLKFADATFDVVWMGDVLEHVFDPINLLREARRVLRPTGRLLVSTPNDLALPSRYDIGVRGRSPQSTVYRNREQCKHHTVFSWELLEYMLDHASLTVSDFRSLVPIRHLGRFSTRVATKRRGAGRLFGDLFVVAAKPR
jgi:2-polyprenyl-3-methyl-5-hydroxy-6-metoxy-1,4-benzoquinol methylase